MDVWLNCNRGTLNKPNHRELMEDTFIEQWYFSKGTPFIAFETKNFGYIIFGPDVMDKRGFKPPKRIFRY